MKEKNNNKTKQNKTKNKNKQKPMSRFEISYKTWATVFVVFSLKTYSFTSALSYKNHYIKTSLIIMYCITYPW